MAPASTSPANVTPRDTTTFVFTPNETGRFAIKHTVHGFSGTLIVETQRTVGVAEQRELPVDFSLLQNFPNPFNPVTTLRYQLPQRTEVLLVVYDVTGREVRRLVDGIQPPGHHQIKWDGKANLGRQIPSGIYIARLVAPKFTKSLKMLLIK